MPNDSFKTRLEIAKKMINKNKNNEQNTKTSNFGDALRLIKKRIAADEVGSIIRIVL